MKVAIPCTEQDEIFQHFGHAEHFAIYEDDGCEYVYKKLIHSHCKGHDQTAILMHCLDVNAVICGNIGENAIAALTKYNIFVYGGVEGNTDQAYYNLVAGQLTRTSSSTCVGHNCSCGSGGCSCGCH